MKQNIKIAYPAILSFIFMGVLTSLEGMVNKNLSVFFDYNLSYFVSIDGFIVAVALLVNYLYRYVAKGLALKISLCVIYTLFIGMLATILVSLYLKNIHLYTVATLFLGIPTGLMYPCINSILHLSSSNISSHFKITCFSNAFWSVGFLLGSVVTNWIEFHEGIKYVYIFILFYTFVMLIVSFSYTARSSLLNMNITSNQELSLDAHKNQTAKRGMFLIAFAFTLLTATQSLFTYWSPNYVKSITSISSNWYGFIIGAFGLGQFISRISFGVFNIRFQVMFFIAFLLSMAWIVSLFFGIFKTTAILIMICFFLGIFTGPLLPAMIAYFMKINPFGHHKMISRIIFYGTAGNVINILLVSYIFYKIDLAYFIIILPVYLISCLMVYCIGNWLISK